MPKQKSFLKNISTDIAKQRHSCQHNSTHTILKGDKRLKLAIDRSQEYFCVQCAIDSIDRDIAKLNEIRSQLLAVD
jgi:hypothetical protein